MRRTRKNYSQNDLDLALAGAKDLIRADLTEADLTGANLTGADLYGADLTDAILTDAILTNVKYDYSTIWPEGFTPPRQNRPARYRDNSTASDVNKFFGALGSGVSDGAIKKGLEYFVRGQREDGEAFLRPYMSEVPASRRKEIFDAADKLRVKPGEDYRSAAVQKYLTDVLVPWFRKTLAATR
jgi:hypothetical protein